MKKIIKIAHLYYDILNLYGENGNIKALVRFIERQGVEVQVDRFGLGDSLNFRKYDFYYIGSGSEQNEMFVLGDLLHYRDAIAEAIDNGKMFLVTGNIMEIFGRKLSRLDGRDIKGLSIFGYNSRETKERNVGEIAYRFEELADKGEYIVGFKNCSVNIVNNDYDRPFGPQDNIRQNNFFAMSFFGPVLIRNPYFTDYLLKILFEDLGYEYKEDDSGLEYVAYNAYVKNFIDNAN